MKSVVFFNNKGGVGKTTLTCNVVSYLSQQKNKRVLLVDADPQCNATQSLLTEDECIDLYKDHPKAHKTLFNYLSTIEAGEAAIGGPIDPLLGTQNKFGTDLIPGHPHLSLVEDKLSGAWSDMLGGTPAGYRITNWCSQLFQEIENRYDLVVFDVGPSLGALNRTVILSADYVVTPLGCDIFSLLGVQNISSWMGKWKTQYDRSIRQFGEDRPELVGQYPIIMDTAEKFRFAGYSVQQYVTRSFKTGPRAVKAYDRILADIPGIINQSLPQLRPARTAIDTIELGDIPFLYSLVPLAQSQHSPIHQLDKNARLVGSQIRQVAAYKELMNGFCDRLLSNMGVK
ncbi:ParA family protein [Caballeronia zhejiangensis]|uniref:ParA family protein n=1 Tax=Caballeronia zhejiangensis TaxID=871203 RepID=UPI00158D7FCB|nr:ParA family protein [Caballeronia zhejiangensis]MCI1042249.1 ParA family protein [Caballeronia zhejiangensis]